MKRRDFLVRSTMVAMALGTTGCGLGAKRYNFKEEYTSFTHKVEAPKPKSGTMPMGEVGTTGIKVSKLCFGSHMPLDAVKYEDERRKIIHEAYDYGVNFFDVYDIGQKVFQFEPMGRHLAPMINDVVISIIHWPYDGRTSEEEMERDLRLFKRDYIDLVRLHINQPNNIGGPDSPLWDKVLRYKEKGYIRAVGLAIHDIEQLDSYIDRYPLDYVLFPYNFHHNIGWTGERPDDYDPLPARLRKRGIGVLTMKPFAGDNLATPFKNVARQLVSDEGQIFNQAALRYVINSGIDADAIFTGMYTFNHFYENLPAFFDITITDEERKLLKKLSKIADKHADALLPPHYKFLNKWATGKTHTMLG